MKRIVSALIVAAIGGAAHAQLIDNFTSPSTDYTIPTMPDYGDNESAIPGPLFDTRNLSASNFLGGANDTFTVSAPGTGVLTASGTGSSSGQLDLTYFEKVGVSDLSADNRIAITVSGISGSMNVGWGFYSGGYQESSGNGVISGVGTTILDFSSLGGAPVNTGSINNLFIDVSVPSGGSISISQIAALPTPEPTPIAAMALGVGLLALRRRK